MLFPICKVKSIISQIFPMIFHPFLGLGPVFLRGGLRSETQLAAHVAATTASDWAFLVVRGAPKAATALVGAAMGQKDIFRVHQVGG
jgi:Na+-driven multidrug efflux pump